jgi:hypothetical protein
MLALVAVSVALAVAAAVALPFLVDTPRVQTLIASNASHALGRAVRFETVSISVFPLPAVELRGLEVAEDPRFGTSPFVRLDRGELRLRLGSLLRGRLEFGDLILKKPVVAVIQDAAGRWNFASLGAPAPEPRPGPARPRGSPRTGGGGGAVLASRVKLDDGVVTYVSRGRGRAAGAYRLEDVDVTLTPDAGAFAVGGSARLMPGAVAIKLTDVTIRPNGTRALTEAKVGGRLGIDGKDLKSLVATVLGPEPSVGGAVKGALSLDGTVGHPKASGDIELPGLSVTRTNPACAEPKTRTLALDRVRLAVTWDDGQLVARPLSAGVANGTVTANVVATLEGGHVDLKDVAVKGAQLDTLLVEFLCQGYAVTGPLDLTGNFGLALRNPFGTLSGAGQLRIGSGKVVGAQALRLLGSVARVGGAVSGLLGADPAAIGTSPLEFESITGTFQAAQGVVTTRDLLYTGRGLKMAAAGEYGLASGRMNMDVTLDHARGQLQAQVTGTAASPSIRVSPSSVMKSVDPRSVERGLQDLLKRFR